MQLIQLTENLFVNADSIDSIEFAMIDGKKQFLVTVRGRQIFVNRNPSELMRELIKAGSTNVPGQFFSV